MREVVLPTISLEVWAVRAYICMDGLMHSPHNRIIFSVQDLSFGKGNRVGWLVLVDVAQDL